MSDHTALVKDYVERYYSSFDLNRERIICYYHPDTYSTIEGVDSRGVDGVRSWSRTEPIVHEVHTIDTQVSGSGYLALVTGSLTMGYERPAKFCQLFHVVQSQGSQSLYLHNDILRIFKGQDAFFAAEGSEEMIA